MHIAKAFGTNFTKDFYPQVTNYANLSQTEYHVYVHIAHKFLIIFLEMPFKLMSFIFRYRAINLLMHFN